MEITLRGWSRDMGTKTMVSLDLADMRVSRDPQKYVEWRGAGLFKSFGEVSVAWCQELNKTGTFYTQLNFTRGDAAQIFKAMFGSELNSETVEQYGFTLSDELKKKVLGEIKFADLTIGELAGLAAPKRQEQPEEQEVTPATVKSFPRT